MQPCAAASALDAALGASLPDGGFLCFDDEECAVLLPLLCESGRAFLHHHGVDEVEPLAWDEGEPWALGVTLTTDPRAGTSMVIESPRATKVCPVSASRYVPSVGRPAKDSPFGSWRAVTGRP